MNRNIASLICALSALLLGFMLSACEEDNNIDYPDTKLIKGQWELIDDGDNDNSLIYRFTTDSENTWSWGGLVTYILSPDDTVVRDKRYTWHVSDPANEEDGIPRLELSWFDAPDSDDLWAGTEYYIVVKLTPEEMWLKRYQTDLPQEIKKFIRRNDLD